MIVRIVAALAVILLANLSAHAQQAPSRLDEIIKRGTLRVGMTGDYKPFTYLDKATQQFSGFDVDMAEALGKALGVKIEFVPTAWPKLMKDFEADQFDMAMGGVSVTLDRQEKAYWLQRDTALKAFVDQWLHISMEDGSYKRIYAAWFD